MLNIDLDGGEFGACVRRVYISATEFQVETTGDVGDGNEGHVGLSAVGAKISMRRFS